MLRSRNTTARLAIDGVTTLLFLGAIVAPSVDQCLRPDSVREPRQENRTTRPLPPPPRTLRDLSTYPAALEGHHADTFGLRDVLLHWNSIVKMGTWGVTPTPLVVLDPSGWLDYAGEHTFEVRRGMYPLTQPELEKWTKYFATCQDFCARNGARYLFVMAPNKESIYPDHVPPLFRPLGPSRADQVVAALTDEIRPAFLDLRPVLTAARSDDAPRDHLYLESGTHWNGRGAWVAYHAVMDRIAGDFPGAHRLKEDEIRWSINPSTDFDSWGPRLYQPGVFPVTTKMPQAKGRQHWQEVEVNLSQGRWHLRNPSIAGPRVLVNSDSFGPAFWELFPSTFSEVDFVQSDFPVDLILSEHPDIVIEVRVERSFVLPPFASAAAMKRMEPPPPPPADDAVVLSIDPSAAFSIDVSDGARVERTHDGFLFETRDEKCGWILPSFEVPAGKRAWLHVEIESDTPGVLVAGRRTSAAGPWLRRDATSFPYFAGRHDQIVLLHGETGAQELRLCLLGTSSRVILRHIEVHTGT